MTQIPYIVLEKEIQSLYTVLGVSNAQGWKREKLKGRIDLLLILEGLTKTILLSFGKENAIEQDSSQQKEM